MIKNTLKIGILSLLGLIIMYFISFGLQNYLIKKSLEKFNEEKLDNSHAFIRCNLDILKPEYAYIFFTGEEGNVSFDSLSKIIWKAEDWNNSYTGGTTIKNTTFPKLVEMVKEDCSQFQEDYDNPDPNGIDWGYREAEPPKTEEELERGELRAINSFIRTTTDYLGDDSWLTQAQKDRFVELYGDFNSMSHEEQVALAKEVLASGGVDPSVLEAE